MSDGETGRSVGRGGVLCGPDVALRGLRAARAVGPASTPAALIATPAHGVAAHLRARLSPNDTIKEFCTGCHNQYDLKGELDLENFDVAKAG